MELRSHSSVSCHLVAIHGTPTRDEGNVTQIYYRLNRDMNYCLEIAVIHTPSFSFYTTVFVS
jgi:hypothetical protein